MRHTATLALCAAITGGCSLSFLDDLDKIKAEAWVDVSSAPSDVASQSYPVAIAAAGDSIIAAGTTAGSIAGQSQNALVQLDYSLSGDVQPESFAFDPGVDPLPVAAVLVGDPGADTVALGGLGEVTLIIPGTDAAPTIGTAIDLMTPAAQVDAIAFGDTDTGAPRDLVAVHGDRVTLVSDYDGAATAGDCLVTGPLSVAMGDLPGGSTSDAIVVGTSTQLHIFDGSDCATLASATTLSAPAGVTFGGSLVIGDFDGNAISDIAVGSSGAVHVYIDSQMSGLVTLEITDGVGGGFGETLAVGELSGGGGDELIVSASTASPDGTMNAGLVAVFAMNAAGTSFEEPQILHDFSPEKAQGFGSSIAVAKFGGGDILVVGSNTEVFTYFRQAFPDSTDPRQQ